MTPRRHLKKCKCGSMLEHSVLGFNCIGSIRELAKLVKLAFRQVSQGLPFISFEGRLGSFLLAGQAGV